MAVALKTSLCPVCSALRIDHDEIVQKCSESLFWTAYYLCEWKDLSFELHWAVCEWIERGLAAGKRNFLIMKPRGHLKSSIFSVAFPVHMLKADPNRRILVVSSTAPLASDKLTQAREILGRDRIAHFFPDLVPNKDCKSTATEVEVPRTAILGEPSIRALGSSTRVVGGHYDIIIADDLVDGESEDSEQQMRQAIRWLERSNPLFHRRAEGVLIVVGTFWPGGFYEQILENPDFEHLVLGCWVDERYFRFMQQMGIETSLPEGTPIYPERETTEGLLAAKRLMGPYNFSHQMENLRADSSMRTFHEEDIQYYTLSKDGSSAVIPPFKPRLYTTHTKHEEDGSFDAEGLTVPLRTLYRTITVDPATGEHSRTDESAIVVCGQDRRNGFMFVLDIWHGRVLADALIDKILDLAEQWEPHVIAPEETAFQKTLKVFMRQRMLERRLHYNIRPVTPGTKSKVFRIIDSFQPFVRKRQVYFRRGEHQDLINEMLSLQVISGGRRFAGKSPNLVDALAYHVEFWKGKDTVVEEDEVEFVDAWAEPAEPLYGLECYT